MNNALSFLVLTTLLIVWLILRLLRNIEPKNYENATSRDESALDTLLGRGSQSELGKRDCNVEVLYAMDDEQCSMACREPGLFRVRNGACVNALTFEGSKAQRNECDAKRGVLAFLVGNSQFGSTDLLCLSVDPGIQPDDTRAENRICSGGGTIEIDYLLGYPQIGACRCPSDKLLTYVESTSAVRAYGLCVAKELEPIYRYNNLVYDDSVVVAAAAQ